MAKVNLNLRAKFVRGSSDDIKVETFCFITRFSIIDCDTKLDSWFTENCNIILEKLEEFQERGSGWALQSLVNLVINNNKYYPIKIVK